MLLKFPNLAFLSQSKNLRVFFLKCKYAPVTDRSWPTLPSGAFALDQKQVELRSNECSRQGRMQGSNRLNLGMAMPRHIQLTHSSYSKRPHGTLAVPISWANQIRKQGEPENPKDKPDTCKPIFNVRLVLRVHFVIWITISTWESKRTSNGNLLPSLSRIRLSCIQLIRLLFFSNRHHTLKNRQNTQK